MITNIKEKLADMQAKYIDKQSAEDNLKTVYNLQNDENQEETSQS